MKQAKYLLVIDLEATCSEDGAVPRQEMEIIEIGAVMLAVADLALVSDPLSIDSISDEFQTFVKPVRHSQLSQFCKTLTSIQQVDVDQAPLYQDAIKAMSLWIDSFAPIEEILFCSWGAYDKNQFQQDCIWNGVTYPFADTHCNIKKLYSKMPGQKKPKGLGKVIKELGWEFAGSHHRGIDDARNIARVVGWLTKNGVIVQPD